MELRRLVVIAALSAAGCDRVFQLLEVPPNGTRTDAFDDDAARLDGAADAAAQLCLADDFDAASLDTSTWTAEATAPATVAQSAGQLRFTLGMDTGVSYAVIRTATRDMTNDSVEI